MRILLRISFLVFMTSIALYAADPTATYPPRRMTTDDVTLVSNFTLHINSSTGNAGSEFLATGVVTLGGTFTLIATGAPFPTGVSYIVIANDGTDPIVGTFIGLPEASLILSGGQLFRVSYVGGTGNDFVLTTVGAEEIPALQPVILVALALMLTATAIFGLPRL